MQCFKWSANQFHRQQRTGWKKKASSYLTLNLFKLSFVALCFSTVSRNASNSCLVRECKVNVHVLPVSKTFKKT